MEYLLLFEAGQGGLFNSAMEMIQHRLDLRYAMLCYLVWVIPTIGFIGDEVFDVGRRYADDIGDLVRKNSGGCFGAGTQVQNPKGSTVIEAIQVGDLVLAEDEESGETAFKPVDEVFHYDQPRMLYALTLADEQSNADALEVIDDHPFWVQGRGWLQSGRIVSGMVVRGTDGRWLKVVSWRPVERIQLTYNFDVADFDSFFVGEREVWVYNWQSCDVTIVAARAISRRECPIARLIPVVSPRFMFRNIQL